MTAHLSGVAILRCEEHPRSDEIDGVARAVLAAMALFVGTGARHVADPQCVAAQSAIARRSGFGVTAVGKAQKRLAALGLIERAGQTGPGLSYTVRWRLLLLRPEARSDGSGPATVEGPYSVRGTEENRRPYSVRGTEEGPGDGGGSVPGTEERSVRGTEERPVRGTDNPSDSVPTSREGRREEDRTSASAPASAGAPACAAESSNERERERESGGIVGEVAEAFGFDAMAAQRWIDRKLDASTTPVRSTTGYIRRCLESERATRSSTPRSSGKASTHGDRPGGESDRSGTASRNGAGSRTGKGRGAPTRDADGRRLRNDGKPIKRSDQPGESELIDIATAVRGGESVASVAERTNFTEHRVAGFCRDVDHREAWEAIDRGEDPATVAERFPRAGTADALRRQHRNRFVRPAVFAVIDRDADPEREAATVAASLAEPVAAVLVELRERVREEQTVRDRRRRAGMTA